MKMNLYKIPVKRYKISESSENPTTLVRTGKGGIIFTTATKAKAKAKKKKLKQRRKPRIIYVSCKHPYSIISSMTSGGNELVSKKSKGKRMNFTFHVSFSPHPHIIFLQIHAASSTLKFFFSMYLIENFHF
jgi:hypothetical protein